MVQLAMTAVLLGMLVFADAGCCGCGDKSPTQSGAGGGSLDGDASRAGATTRPRDEAERGVLRGRVVNEPPGEGRVGIERWRFQPEGEAGTYLRLTRTRMQEARPPEAGEIRLDPWAGNDIRVRHQARDNTWVWGAEVLD